MLIVKLSRQHHDHLTPFKITQYHQTRSELLFSHSLVTCVSLIFRNNHELHFHHLSGDELLIFDFAQKGFTFYLLNVFCHFFFCIHYYFLHSLSMLNFHSNFQTQNSYYFAWLEHGFQNNPKMFSIRVQSHNANNNTKIEPCSHPF